MEKLITESLPYQGYKKMKGYFKTELSLIILPLRKCGIMDKVISFYVSWLGSNPALVNLSGKWA